jgi:NAD(P)-dependent dehydrogenase (short-subunit alcohol dehydrogenase family)
VVDVAGARVEPMPLEDAAAVRAVVDAAAPAVVVYAAGPAIGQPYLSNVGVDEWRAAVDAEVHGFFHLVSASLPHLRRARGALVALTSAGLLRTPPRDVLSVAPKAAIAALVAAVAREEGRFGVRANCVAPGVIEAGMFLRLRETAYDAATLEAMRRNTPLGRFGTAEDVAEAVAFLASARFVTGQTLAVDGGYSA